MKRAALATLSVLAFAAPAYATDLYDAPVYRERDVYIDRPARPIVEQERIIERRYYVEPRVERRVEEYIPIPRARVYGRDDYYYDDAYRYRRPIYYGGPRWRHHHYDHW